MSTRPTSHTPTDRSDASPPHDAGAGPRRFPSLIVSTVLLLAAAATGFVWHDLNTAYRNAMADWNVRLTSSVEARVRTARLWRTDRRMDIELLTRNPLTARLLASPRNASAAMPVQRAMEKELEVVRAGYGYLAAAVLDDNCRMAAQVGTQPPMVPQLQRACRAVLRAGGFRVGGFGTEAGRLDLTLAGPVYAATSAGPGDASGQRPAGVVVMVSDPWKDITPLIAFDGAGAATDETLLVWNEGSEAFIFLPRLQSQGAPAFFRQPLNSPGIEARVADNDNMPFGEFTDYRGKSVLAVGRQIAPDEESLVRKVDLDEALASFHRRALLEVLAAGLAVLCLASVMVAHERRVAARGLTEQVEQQRALLEVRRQAEESEAKFSRAFRASPASLSISRLSDGRLIEVNDTFLELFEYKREEVIGRTSLELNLWVDPGDRPRLIASLREAGRVRNREFRHRSSSGRLFTVLSSSEMIELAGVECLLATFVDITRVKEADEALRLSDHRYRDFIAHSNEGVWRVELEQPIPAGLPAEESVERLLRYGVMAECNAAHARHFGFASAEELIGKRLGDLVSRSDVERLESLRTAAQGGWHNRTVEFRGQDNLGAPRWLQRTETPIVEQGCLVRMWGFTRDLTELKRAQEQLQRAYEQSRALAARVQSVREEERKRVAREIHDELGQGLTAIRIDLASMIRDLPPGARPPKSNTESIFELVDTTIQAVRRISTELRPGMLDDLGLVATVEWAGEEFEARTGTRCRLTLPSREIEIEPERATAVFRIFQETLTNVARHAGASAVDVRLTEDGGQLELEVRDNGKGIAPESLSNRRSLGILGMRERAVLLGGDVTISGVPGKGTTVRVRIPDARAAG